MTTYCGRMVGGAGCVAAAAAPRAGRRHLWRRQDDSGRSPRTGVGLAARGDRCPFHGPGWTPRETFAAEVEAFSAQPGWVTEWQYGSARALLAQRTDLLVWLDLPRATVMRQVAARTVRRRFRRQVLWNGNIEPPLWRIFKDREHIVRWAWTTHAKTARRVAALRQQRPELTIVRLRNWGKAQQWLDGAVRDTVAAPS